MWQAVIGGGCTQGREVVGANRNLPREMPAGEGRGGGEVAAALEWPGFVCSTRFARFATLARAIPR